jgi:hypothetical protein
LTIDNSDVTDPIRKVEVSNSGKRVINYYTVIIFRKLIFMLMVTVRGEPRTLLVLGLPRCLVVSIENVPVSIPNVVLL